jgi:hypothetical protein
MKVTTIEMVPKIFKQVLLHDKNYLKDTLNNK